jgi:hypothetical protein
MSEADTLRAIHSALTSLGYWVIRIHSGKVRVKRGFMQLAPVGTPDLLVLDAMGFLEVKTADKASKPSAEQLAWHERAAKLGVRVAVVRSVGEAIAKVREWE